jgi:hypothetical protein
MNPVYINYVLLLVTPQLTTSLITSLQMDQPMHECVTCGHQDVLHAVINHVIKTHLQPSETPWYCMKCHARIKTRQNALRHLQKYHHQDYRQPLTKMFAGRRMDWTAAATRSHTRPCGTQIQPPRPIGSPQKQQMMPVSPIRENSVELAPLPITPGKEWYYPTSSPRPDSQVEQPMTSSPAPAQNVTQSQCRHGRPLWDIVTASHT